jgi:hypothetical protein
MIPFVRQRKLYWSAIQRENFSYTEVTPIRARAISLQLRNIAE